MTLPTSQIRVETRYLEATRIYRNYRTTQDEIGRPNPLLAPTANEATRAELRIDRDGMKRYLSSPSKCCYHTCLGTHPLLALCCSPCICYKINAALQLVDPAADAHTLVLRERTLYYKVTPYNAHGLVNEDHWRGLVLSNNMKLTSKPGKSEPRLGFDGFVPRPTGMNVNLEQVIPLELIDEIKLIPASKHKPFHSLVVHVRVPNFNRIRMVQVDMPLNGASFRDAVLNAQHQMSDKPFSTTHTALYQEYVEYLASMKKVTFANWQAKNGGLVQNTPTAVAVEITPPVAVDMSRGGKKDLAGQLRELKELFDAGALSEEEFATAKQSTLAGVSGTKEAAPLAPSAPPSAPPAPSLPAAWIEHVDEATGRPFYYNEKTQETSWDRPTN
jgi:hypothetical protein